MSQSSRKKRRELRPSAPTTPTDSLISRAERIERTLARVRSLGYEDYRSYLESERWHQKRLQFLREREVFCVSCGRYDVQIHHRTYLRVGAEEMEDLDALCQRCHSLAHLAVDRELVGITLWNCSRRVAHLKQLGFPDRFDVERWNLREQTDEKIAAAKAAARKKRKRWQPPEPKRPTGPIDPVARILEETRLGLDKHRRQRQLVQEGPKT